MEVLESLQGLTGSNSMAVIYNDTMKDLRAAIVAKFGSFSELAKSTGLDRHNLSRLFSDQNPREMSIGTYITICDALGLCKASSFPLEMARSKISLKQYLEIDNNAIIKNILLIRFL